MSADNGGLWITFNGEIFNYLELEVNSSAKEFASQQTQMRKSSAQQYLLKANVASKILKGSGPSRSGMSGSVSCFFLAAIASASGRSSIPCEMDRSRSRPK